MTDTRGTSTCRECGATLRFVRMRSGKPMPVDPVADPRGNVAALKVGDRYSDGRVITQKDPAAVGEVVFNAHWNSCPMGRRKKAAAPKPVDPQDQLF